MHTYFNNLSYKKRKVWLSDFIMDATTSCIDEDQANHRAIAHTFRLEFTKQPYAGFYLFHLLFKEFADMREIVQKAFENATPFDYIVHVSMMDENQLQDGLKSYFDINRVMKLSEKFADEEVINVLEQVI